jgi:hypothetical protein
VQVRDPVPLLPLPPRVQLQHQHSHLLLEGYKVSRPSPGLSGPLQGEPEPCSSFPSGGVAPHHGCLSRGLKPKRCSSFPSGGDAPHHGCLSWPGLYTGLAALRTFSRRAGAVQQLSIWWSCPTPRLSEPGWAGAGVVQQLSIWWICPTPRLSELDLAVNTRGGSQDLFNESRSLATAFHLVELPHTTAV